MASGSTKTEPLISEKYLDYPSQRLYSLSIWLVCQTIKVADFLWYIASRGSSLSLCGKWLLVDSVFVVLLSCLRIPRLTYSKSSVVLQIVVLWLLDGILFGGISLNRHSIPGLSGASPVAEFSNNAATSTFHPSSILDTIAPYSFGLLSSSLSSSRDGHLLGQHTVRMSPISTAQLNPLGLHFCLSHPSGSVLLPILLNNTNISGLRYSITPLGHSADQLRGKVEVIEMSARDLKAVEQAHKDKLQLTRPSGINSPHAVDDHDEQDEYDDDDDDSEPSDVHPSLQKTQTVTYIQVSRPGIVRLERVHGTANIEARVASSEVVIVQCPHVAFVDQSDDLANKIRCAGQDSELQLMINVYGIPPLSLRWWRVVNGNREQYLVEGIEGEFEHKHSPGAQNNHNDPLVIQDPSQLQHKIILEQSLKIPLTVSLERPGTYLYGLEEIVDGIGNGIRIGSTDTNVAASESTTNATRSFTVLRKPSVSFVQCSLDAPAPLLIGSEATLSIKTVDADLSDAPWEVVLQYQPPNDFVGTKGTKKFKSWNKTLTVQGERKELSFRASNPGDYSIVNIKGKYCTGTLLAPNTCKVVERPLPSAEIEWKRIHECSGDTGVSASLILRGVPPFQVYYRMQRDNEPPREFSRTFGSSRGELTLQPERSGHYIFTFVQMSDANYKKVELQGPSIEQIIHPLASADFADSYASGRNRRIISSCAGDTVDVDVNLRGTGPWNLDVQIIGPQSSEILQVHSIETPKTTLQIPIPKSVVKGGGSFEIDLVSIEDAYKCKKPVAVPGIVVNVKRTRPTARFYGSPGERQVTVTERERANLPLRLTGDGPWRIRYHRLESADKISTVRVHNPNDFLQVNDQGIYEIVDVADSQCPGMIVTDSSTYKVDWIPRPTAQLSSETHASYIPYNNSYMLQPVCEGVDDHVDLDLTGRPPFQIMYNIAQSNEQGGTKLMDQPIFNSIQPHTRFQLHTTTPGRIYYEVKQIGDSAYPLEKYGNMAIPRSARLLFEQQVSMRPSAQFKNRNRLTYCLYDAFVPLDVSSTDGVIAFVGTPPFTLTLSIKNVAASQVQTLTIKVPSHTWRMDLPSYTFISIGPHRISIDSVTDATNCAQSALDPLLSSTWVDVAETAAIIPFERREDLCAGEVSQFQLEGIPPWTIGYRINGKTYTKEAKVSPFSILQQQTGEFTITHIAHQQKMCKAVVTDLRFHVHPLPSAQVGHGKKIYQDIHEGDQAEILFTLVGEPPFTFTYQRSEPISKKGGKPGKVLETHTVSRVLTHEYSIFSALEGTWTVTSISDKYCRYPPSQPDLAIEKQK